MITAIAKIQNSFWYAAIMIVLALITVGFLLYEFFYPEALPVYVALGQKIDLIVAYIFLGDFLVGFLFTAQLTGRKKYLKQNWLNAVSSLPISGDVARALRFLRILRATRVARSALDVQQAFSRMRQ